MRKLHYLCPYCTCIEILIACCFQGLSSQTVTLSPERFDVMENSNITLTCTTHDTACFWTNSAKFGVWPVMVLHNDCLTSGFLNDSLLFSTKCHGNGSFSVTILKVNLKQHNVTWQCMDIKNTLSNKATVYIQVPATGVTLGSLSGDYIKENSSLKISCNTSASRPDPRVHWFLRSSHKIIYNLTRFSSSTYSNSEYGLSSANSVLDFTPNRTVNGFRLYCEVWTRTDNADITSGEFIVNVTYPPSEDPSIQGFENNEVIWVNESDTGKFVCSVTGGNPLVSLSWNCFNSTDTTLVTNGNTVTSIVSWTAHRNHKICSCLANHSTGWKKITTVSVNVQFPTEIRTFTLTYKSSEEINVINEADSASLVCLAEANPLSNLTIEHHPNGDICLEVSNTNIANYTLRSAIYVHAGEYTCIGKNNHTKGLPARFRLILIVRCPPRPSSEDIRVIQKAAILYSDASLKFSARKYLDEPGKTVFGWFKEDNEISDGDMKYKIRSDELQTTLTIMNITSQDLGFYRVLVRNSAGEYIHYYKLFVAGRPDVPRDFRIITGSNTESTVSLTWFPGFNGGSQQTFVFIYKMKLEKSWINDSITDNGKEIMFFALLGLTSMQEYEIEMYAINIEGKSDTTERLTFKTKSSIQGHEEFVCPTKTGVFIGISAGTFLSTLAFCALVFIGHKRLRTIKHSSSIKQKKGKTIEHQLPITEESQISSPYNDLLENKREVNAYDVLNVQDMSTSSGVRDLTLHEVDAYVEKKNTSDVPNEKTEYINIQI